ncbi:uncharacterized protein K441DRAFT_660137 [Cenococcum geophilum 1.58]|uniref:uncharacterized protein n=1 Tax=Cenococcum geophilum 1.58 TaxID=794803 RepID=UPI00358EF616|nr:hypothetical protein K441DRAFT_660137 [Cenococcum geophilum 1.58]
MYFGSTLQLSLVGGTACETTAITQPFTRSFRTSANIPGIVFRKGTSEVTLTITISMLPTRTHDRCGEATACFKNYVERVRLKVSCSLQVSISLSTQGISITCRSQIPGPDIA